MIFPLDENVPDILSSPCTTSQRHVTDGTTVVPKVVTNFVPLSHMNVTILGVDYEMELLHEVPQIHTCSKM